MRWSGLVWNGIDCARLGLVEMAWIIWSRLSWATFGSTKLVSAGLWQNSGGLVLADLDWALLKRARLGWPYLWLVELNYAGLGRTGLGWNGLGRSKLS